MKNYKILVTSDIIPEVLGLFESLGYHPYNNVNFYIEQKANAFYAEEDSFSFITGGCGYAVKYTADESIDYYNKCENTEITLAELRSLVKTKESGA